MTSGDPEVQPARHIAAAMHLKGPNGSFHTQIPQLSNTS
jgi:hypothetical protein